MLKDMTTIAAIMTVIAGMAKLLDTAIKMKNDPHRIWWVKKILKSFIVISVIVALLMIKVSLSGSDPLTRNESVLLGMGLFMVAASISFWLALMFIEGLGRLGEKSTRKE